MKKLIVLFLAICTVFALTGCVDEIQNVESKQQQQTKELMTEMDNQIGLPNIHNFFEKKTAKQIFELRDDSKLITYAYFQNQFTGKFTYLGQCIGFGLPYSVQYTSPQQYTGVKTERIYSSAVSDAYSYEVMPQADPNGLYMPEGLSATWLVYINPETGKNEVIYTEPSIVVTQSPLPRRLVETWSLGDNYPDGKSKANTEIK